MFPPDHTWCVLARDHEQFDPHAIVAFFPSDHYYADNVAFASAVRSALHIATEYPHSLILIGGEADSPEIEYGWIEPGRVIVDSRTARLHRVRRFSSCCRREFPRL
jgi:mannose-1-phosphate guanylyltransferase